MHTTLFTRTALGLLAILVGHYAQTQVPSTDLFLFQLIADDTNRWHAHSPQLLSSFNPGGYTNQPEFVGDNLLYVSVRLQNSEQNDIYQLNISQRFLERVTETSAGEYSPTLLPNGAQFSCIREIIGDETNQQLYIYPTDRSTHGQSIDRTLRTVGYHCWLSPSTLAMFLVGDIATLVLYDVDTGALDTIQTGIGRSLRRSDEGQLIYVDKNGGDGEWVFKALNPTDGSSLELGPTLPSSEDFVLGPDNRFFMGMGSRLYTTTTDNPGNWQLIADLVVYGVGNISRLALNSRNQIAIVSSARR